jgi:DNA repair exonuclease SbcCD nuclease subunit
MLWRLLPARSGLRLLHVTDTHLGLEAGYRGAPEHWRRADDHLAALRAALLPAFQGEIDLVIHSGDLFDRSHPPARAVAEARHTLTELGAVVPVIVLAGNHDGHGVIHHFPDGIPGVRLVDEATTLDHDDVRVGLIPYIREAGRWASLAPECDILIAHQTFHGARVPGHTFRYGSKPEVVNARQLPRAPWIACGHIHTRQAFWLGDSEIVHPGSTERTATNEREEPKGYARWTFDRRVEWRLEELSVRPMLLIRDPSELSRVTPGSLVHLSGGARCPEVEEEARGRGGWVAAYKPETRQQRLFRERAADGE